MSLRTVNYELEAKLTGQSGGLFSKPSGKIERKSYADGSERLKISVRSIKVPDQSTAIVTVDDQEIAQLSLIKGSGRLDTESKDSTSIPTFRVGQAVEVRVLGKSVLDGILYED
jgi:hypothetical protein